jgi:DMSO/TMAO reductase YedYZ heme-binding membrane subunit
MVRRKFNTQKKLERIGDLILEILMSLVFPLITFIAEYLTSGGMPIIRALSFLVGRTDLLLLGALLAIRAVTKELMVKNKRNGIKALLGTLCFIYLIAGLTLHPIMQGITEFSTFEDLLKTAEFVVYFYLTGIALSVGAIYAGLS